MRKYRLKEKEYCLQILKTSTFGVEYMNIIISKKKLQIL